MPLLQVVVILIIVGVLLYLFNVYVTAIDARVKTIINWVVIIAIVLWLLSLFGLFGSLSTIRVGHP